MRRRRVRTTVEIAAAVLVAGIAGVGGLHTPWGRSLLMRLPGCPVARVSAAEANELRLIGLRGLQGRAPAPARPALGFVLDRTTPDDVRAWAAQGRVTCAMKGRGLPALHCAHVLRAALPGGAGGRAWEDLRPPLVDDLAFTFDPSGRLVSVDAFTRPLQPAEAAAVFASSDARLRAVLGPAAERGGEPDRDALALARAPLASTAISRYRFSDYVAVVTVSRLPSGLAVRELYLSIAWGRAS